MYYSKLLIAQFDSVPLNKMINSPRKYIYAPACPSSFIICQILRMSTMQMQVNLSFADVQFHQNGKIPSSFFFIFLENKYILRNYIPK